MSLEIIKDTTFETPKLSDTPICNPPSSDNIDRLQQPRNENPFRIIIGHINKNLVRNPKRKFTKKDLHKAIKSIF